MLANFASTSPRGQVLLLGRSSILPAVRPNFCGESHSQRIRRNGMGECVMNSDTELPSRLGDRRTAQNSHDQIPSGALNPMNARILVVEDDQDLRTALCDRLRGEKYVVEIAKDAEEGMDKVNTSPFDLLIVDVMLPYHSGFDLCRELRQSGLVTPIMFLTAKTSLMDKVVGLKLGGDDYLTKPFEADELTARVEALLRRSRFGSVRSSTVNAVHDIGSLRVDMRRQEVTRDGKHVDLTEREFQLLCYLIDHAGETVSRRELLRAVWGYDSVTYSRTVDVHIHTLRQKLEMDPNQPNLIRTVTGSGYRFLRD